MTAEEIYESVTNGGSSDFAEAAAILERVGRWYLMRIAEAFPKLRDAMPREIAVQLEGDAH